jgi:hypothetical protein
MVDSHQISEIRFDNKHMILEVDAKEIKVDLEFISPKLLVASDIERSLYKVSPSGYGIHWPLIDEDLSVNQLIKNCE